MKAILVIDIPETIKREYLNKDLIVQLWDKHDEQYIMHDICKLKPMPQRKPKRDKFPQYTKEYEAYTIGDIDGWNYCLDEILGEEQ